MKRLMFGVLVVGIHVAVARPLVAEAVAWKVSEGGNGNVYEVVLKDKKISWEDAKAEAEAKGGHLVTITSAAENDFVISLTRDLRYWNERSTNPYRYLGPWIGAFQAEGAKEPGGGWGWVTGEDFRWLCVDTPMPDDYWRADYGINENRGVFFCRLTSPLNNDSIKKFRPIWNDAVAATDVKCYVIEFDMKPGKR